MPKLFGCVKISFSLHRRLFCASIRSNEKLICLFFLLVNDNDEKMLEWTFHRSGEWKIETDVPSWQTSNLLTSELLVGVVGQISFLLCLIETT